jgi:hypothetical protein
VMARGRAYDIQSVLRSAFGVPTVPVATRSGEQGSGAMAAVVGAAPSGDSLPHGEDRRGPIQGLDLALLIGAEHQGSLWRVEVRANNVPNLLDELGLLDTLKVSLPWGVSPKGCQMRSTVVSLRPLTRDLLPTLPHELVESDRTLVAMPAGALPTQRRLRCR